jgi:hypothetical protein
VVFSGIFQLANYAGYDGHEDLRGKNRFGGGPGIFVNAGISPNVHLLALGLVCSFRDQLDPMWQTGERVRDYTVRWTLTTDISPLNGLRIQLSPPQPHFATENMYIRRGNLMIISSSQLFKASRLRIHPL